MKKGESWIKVKYLMDWFAYKKGDIGSVSRSSFNHMVHAGVVKKEN